MMTLSLNIPDSWEEDEIVLLEPIKPPTKKKSKWARIYPELAENCPDLHGVLKNLNEEQTVNTLDNYLEAVALWKPKVAFVGKREVDNRSKDKMNYQILYDRWINLISCLGLKENSTILERQKIQTILEKYTNKKIEKTKYILDPQKNSYNIN